MIERDKRALARRRAARAGASALLLLACSTGTNSVEMERPAEYEASSYPRSTDELGSGGSSATGATPTTAGQPASTPGALAPYKEWTFAFYLAAETSDGALGEHYVQWLEQRYAELEPFANVIVLLDIGGPTQLLQIRSDADMFRIRSEIDAPQGTALAELFRASDVHELTLSTPRVLEAFLDLAQSRYPSKYFALTVLDHGEAWNGAVYDETAIETPEIPVGPMSLSDFADVFSSLARPIDVLAFDACLMQELTTHSWWFETSGKVRYVVGSEQENYGWNFDKVMRQFDGLWRSDGGLSPQRLATSFVGQTNEGEWSSNVTESAVDLARWQDVVDSLDTLGARLLEAGGMNDPTVKAIVEQRVTRPYGGLLDATQRRTHEDLVDAVELCELIEQSFPADTALPRAASALRSALGKAVIANSAQRPEGHSVNDDPNPAAEVSHGLSLHLPKTDAPSLLGNDAYAKKLGRVRELFPHWIAFLDTI